VDRTLNSKVVRSNSSDHRRFIKKQLAARRIAPLPFSKEAARVQVRFPDSLNSLMIRRGSPISQLSFILERVSTIRDPIAIGTASNEGREIWCHVGSAKREAANAYRDV